MDIRNSLESLKLILGPETTAPAATGVKTGASQGGNVLGADQATVSSAGSEVSLSATSDGVRADKVSAIQSALAAGTYSVPASAVASRLIDSMLAAGQ